MCVALVFTVHTYILVTPYIYFQLLPRVYLRIYGVYGLTKCMYAEYVIVLDHIQGSMYVKYASIHRVYGYTNFIYYYNDIIIVYEKNMGQLF